MNFGRHEAKGTDDASVHAITGAALNGTGEAEVDDLDVVELVEEDVLALEIAMCKALSVDVVDGLDELLGVVTNDAFFEWTRVGDVVEKLTAVDELTDDVGDIDLITILLVPDSVLVELVVLHDVLVIQGLNGLDFVTEQLEGPLVELWVVEAEDFDGVLGAIRARAQLDFGAEAAAKRPSERVLSDCRCHSLTIRSNFSVVCF